MVLLGIAHQLADVAEDALQRRQHLRRLRAAEQQYLRLVAWHFAQSEIFRQNHESDGASLHAELGLFRQAEARRYKHERKALRSGRSFWATRDIDSWAGYAHSLNSRPETKKDFALLMAELPDEAIRSVWPRIERLARQARPS